MRNRAFGDHGVAQGQPAKDYMLESNDARYEWMGIDA